MRNRCVVRYVHTSSITIDPVFTCPWIEIHPIHGRCSLSARSSRFPKSVDCIIDTNGGLPEQSLRLMSWLSGKTALLIEPGCTRNKFVGDLSLEIVRRK